MSFDRNTYETPQWLFDHYDRSFRFVADMAASPTNAKCDNYWAEFALNAPWHYHEGWLWLNPPYKPLRPWIEKCYEEMKKGTKIAALVPLGTIGNLYFQPDLIARMEFFMGRIQFYYHGRRISGNDGHNVMLFFDRSPLHRFHQPEISWLNVEETEAAWLQS